MWWKEVLQYLIAFTKTQRPKWITREMNAQIANCIGSVMKTSRGITFPTRYCCFGPHSRRQADSPTSRRHIQWGKDSVKSTLISLVHHITRTESTDFSLIQRNWRPYWRSQTYLHYIDLTNVTAAMFLL